MPFIVARTHVLNTIGLPCRSPAADVLLSSTETPSHYPVSQASRKFSGREVERHYKMYTRGFIDKVTIPIYLSLLGARTGKSRNTAEFRDTIYECLWDFFAEINEELATRIKDSFEFHVSLRDLQKTERPMEVIGHRMLLQLLRKDEADPGSIPITLHHSTQYFLRK